jgi:urea ABC transporter substrate-binding protein
VEEINANGGIGGKKVEIIYRDFQSDALLSAEIAWELIEIEKADVIMGGTLSSAREEIRKVANKTKTLYFFDALYEGGVADRYTFCASAVPEQNLYPMLQFLLEKYGKRCYIITADYNYGILSAESAKYYIEKLGGKIAAVEYFQVLKSNFDITIDNIRDAKPDILLSFCVSNNQNNFYKQWHDKGLAGIPVVSTIGIGLSHLHKVFDPPTMENTFFMSSYIEELDTPNAKAFSKKIRDKYPVDVVPYIEFDSESVYTSVYLYKKAVELAGTTETEKVIKALESGKVRFDGPGGMVTVRGEDHHMVRDMILFRVNKDNKVEVLSKYPALHSNYVEKMIEQETGIKGGLRKCGLNTPNIQYNLMFHRIMT